MTKWIRAKFDKKCQEINKNKNKMTTVRQRYQLTPSRNIDDQRFLESDWIRGPISHIQPRVLVLDICP